MKRFIQFLSASVVGLSMMVGVAAAATTSCTISNTGNGSVNSCVDTTSNTTTFFCSNNAQITNLNAQTATSGTATVSGNGSGGTAASGNTSNTVLNNVAAQLGCATSVAVVTPTTPTVAVTPTTPTPAKKAAAPAKAAPVASLPETGSNTVLNDTLIAAVVLGGTLALSQLGVVTYRRFGIK